MGKKSSGGLGVVIAVLALAQRLGGYQNKPLAILLVVAASLSFAWLIWLWAQDAIVSWRGRSSARNLGANRAGLVYRGIGSNRGSWSRGSGMCVPCMVQVGNSQPEEEITLNNVTARIEYIHARDRFTIREALWITVRRDQTGLNVSTEQGQRIFLAANETQCFMLFLEQDRHYWISDNLIDVEKELQPGKWTAQLSVTADNGKPLKGKISFTVVPGPDRKLVFKEPAFSPGLGWLRRVLAIR